MKNENTNLIITTGLAFIYNILFWNESLGINTLIFCLLFITALYFLYEKSFREINVRIVCAGSLLTALLVVIHNSELSKVVHILSMILLIGNIHYPQIRNQLFAFLSAMSGLLTFHKVLSTHWKSFKNSSDWAKRIIRFTRLIIVPIFILTVFYWIFIFANARFNDLAASFWSRIYEYTGYFFENISLMRIFTFGITFFMVGAAIFRSSISRFFEWDQQGNDQLIRTKQTNKEMAHVLLLKTEYKIAVLMVFMVNILLLVINILDIDWIWFNFNPTSINLRQFVHEGTYLLIGSILLSMGIILYFFRSNLNFYSKNKTLKTLCYIWIVQNSILCISVAMRNYHYIDAFGLAYKRIGVVCFLLVTLIGLITLILKIKRTYSNFYLWRINTWSVYLMLVTISLINWDQAIAIYNLEIHKKTLDIEFLLTLSDKTTPILYRHKDLFKDRSEDLDRKVKALYKKVETSSWVAWNYADYQAYTDIQKLK